MTESKDFAYSNRILLSLVNKLCSTLIYKDSDNFDKVCRYSLDLICQKKTKIEECEEQYLLSKIRNSFLKESRLEDLNKFENLYFKLKSSLVNSVNLRELLYLLFLLSNLNSKQNCTLLNSSNNVKTLKIIPNSDLISHEKPKVEINMRKHAISIPRPHTIHGDYKIMSKYSLLAKDLIYIFQGISGKHINFIQNEKLLFNIDKNDMFCANDVYFAKRLSVLGQNFKSIRDYSDLKMNNSSKGLVCQSFGSALNEEVQDFYKLMTSIQANYHNKDNMNTDVTLHKLYIWTFETFTRFEALTNLICKSRSKKGGALISVVYDFMHHGDPIVRECIKKILSKVVKPIRQMMNHWIFYGELKDEFKEFFISLNDNVQVGNALNTDFWFDKYSINKQMLPGFISKQQAYKILNTGKAISMLREVSINKVAIILPVYDQLKHSFENSNLEALFDKRNNSNINDFASLLDYVYKEISKTALNILSAKYVLSDHFYAHKKYLLFEQSDFIYYLMELLHPLLDRPANKLRIYTLSQTLENAIRKTSAQYDSGEIISRLDVFFDPNFQHENGWDIFTFKYRIDGPISTIFTEQSQSLYTKIFLLFWKIKRIDFILNKSWIELKHQNIELTSTSFKSIFNRFYYIMYQISSYVKTIQRYFNYLIESRWTQVKNELNQPRNLDKLIKAHQMFLQNLSKKLFFDDSKNLTNQYETITSHIFNFIEKLDLFLKEIGSLKFKQLKNAWHDEYDQCEKEMNSNYNFWLINFSKIFHKEIVLYLELLVETEEDDLQELCFSIDFNKYYKMNNNC